MSPASPRAVRKPKGEGHERRAEILSAAERIFVEQGYEGATIRKIADAVGLSSTALYMHFQDKSEILAEICRQAFGALLASSRDVACRTEPAEDRLRALMDGYVAFGLANPNAYRLIYLTRPQEAAHGAQDVAKTLGADLFALFAGVVDELDRAGRLRRSGKVTGQALWAGAHGVVSLIITKPYFDWADSSDLANAVLDALFADLIRS